MKRIASILLVISYLTLSVGVVVNFHYCGGEIKSVSLFSSAKSCSKCGKKAMSKDCCKDKSTLIKIDQSQKAPNVLNVSVSFFQFVNQDFPSLSYFSSNFSSVKIAFFTFREKVVTTQPQAYLRHCTFII